MGQKVKGQGQSGAKYAPKCTFWFCSCHMWDVVGGGITFGRVVTTLQLVLLKLGYPG